MKFEFPEVNKISFESKEAVALVIGDPEFEITASGDAI